MSNDDLKCDFQGCTDLPFWHIEDSGAPWQTNQLARNRHLSKLCSKKMVSRVQWIRDDNRSEIEIKRRLVAN